VESLPHNHVTAEYMSVEKYYAEVEPAGGTGLSAAAYATFSFTLSKGSDPDPLVKLRWIENYEPEMRRKSPHTSTPTAANSPGSSITTRW